MISFGLSIPGYLPDIGQGHSIVCWFILVRACFNIFSLSINVSQLKTFQLSVLGGGNPSLDIQYMEIWNTGCLGWHDMIIYILVFAQTRNLFVLISDTVKFTALWDWQIWFAVFLCNFWAERQSYKRLYIGMPEPLHNSRPSVCVLSYYSLVIWVPFWISSLLISGRIDDYTR